MQRLEFSGAVGPIYVSLGVLGFFHCLQWKTPDDWQRNCPKHVEFYSKNKFEKLVHVVGFIIRIYHKAPSPERQRFNNFFMLAVFASSRLYLQTANKILRLSLQVMFKTGFSLLSIYYTKLRAHEIMQVFE